MIQRHSIFDVLVMMTTKYPMYALHPMHLEDRLGNPAIEFPIAMVFGDNDYLGSDGAEDIIKNNKHFKSGRSQLFKMEDCTHEFTWDQPDKTVELMIGFSEGTIVGRFEKKPTYEIAEAQLTNTIPKAKT